MRHWQRKGHFQGSCTREKGSGTGAYSPWNMWLFIIHMYSQELEEAVLRE